jgi:hypothetical protein
MHRAGAYVLLTVVGLQALALAVADDPDPYLKSADLFDAALELAGDDDSVRQSATEGLLQIAPSILKSGYIERGVQCLDTVLRATDQGDARATPGMSRTHLVAMIQKLQAIQVWRDVLSSSQLPGSHARFPAGNYFLDWP